MTTAQDTLHAGTGDDDILRASWRATTRLFTLDPGDVPLLGGLASAGARLATRIATEVEALVDAGWRALRRRLALVSVDELAEVRDRLDALEALTRESTGELARVSRALPPRMLQSLGQARAALGTLAPSPKRLEAPATKADVPAAKQPAKRRTRRRS